MILTSMSSSPSPSESPSPSLPALRRLSSSSKPTYNHNRVQNLVAGLALKGITVTEWGAVLYSRLDVPVSLGQFDFLVDDHLLEAACHFAKEQGFYPTESKPILLKTYGEYEAIARHFEIGRDFNCLTQRVNLFPGSFAGFCANELYKVPLNLGDACAMPVSVFTTKPAPLAASFVRRISQVHFTDPTSRHLKHDLCLVLSYCLFDMSYEGDYMIVGEESQEDIDRQINRGLDLYRRWEGWRTDEMWIADALEAIIQGKGDYNYLPGAPFKDIK